MNDTLLPAIELETGPEPENVVIWLHGLGADGNDFAPIVPALGLPKELAVRFIFPHAPSIPVTVNGGFVMPAWYDIAEMEIDRKVDHDGIMESTAKIRAFIDREVKNGIKPERIIVAGFSQGGAIAYQTALSHDQRLGGLLTMSSYFATADTINYHPANKDIPISIQHGTADPVVPEILGDRAQAELTQKGYQVDYTTYAMEHAVHPQQIGDISRWLQSILNTQ